MKADNLSGVGSRSSGTDPVHPIHCWDSLEGSVSFDVIYKMLRVNVIVSK